MNQFPPQPPPTDPRNPVSLSPQPQKKKVWPWILLGVVLVPLVLIGGCTLLVGTSVVSGLAASESATSAAEPTIEPTTEEPTEEPTAEATTATFKPKKSDIELTIKVKSKKCYGYGVGCTITYRVEAAADRDGWPKEGTLDVTYKITGGEDGPERNTLTMDLEDGTYSQDGYQYAQTSGSGVKLKIAITDLDYSEY